MKEFQKGQMIRTASGGQCEIIQKLGEGGQGVVYKVNYNGRPMALKWYFGNKLSNADKFYDNIRSNIKKGAPTDSFLWPEEITERFDGSFGYLMKLRPSEYKDFSLFLLAKARFSGLYAVVNAALSITNSFRELHNRGYSYQDLNDGNFFVNPNTGDVLICDNDNVAPYGENLGIAGKCRYMAPEVVVGRKRPDVHTDRFSLAVVLYLLLFLNHPLEGAATNSPCLTEEHERHYFGTDPIFVWDPQNNANRPIPELHRNELKIWPLYPEAVKNTFIKAFSRSAMVGDDATHRVIEKEWQEVFTDLRDSIVTCACGGETFADLSGSSFKCINCGRMLARPMCLKVKRYCVPLVLGKKIYACHAQYDSDDYREVRGEVISSKNTPNVLGLRNDSGSTWVVMFSDGSSKGYEKSKVIKLERGLKINFGNGNIAEII